MKCKVECKVERKPCEKCSRKALAGERFCSRHRSELMREMIASGYLTPLPKERRYHD